MHMFTKIRLWAYVIVMASAAVVLGLSADLASKFLPNIHKDFGIYSLVAPSLTITLLILLLLRSQPRIDVFFAFVLAVIWLTMGAWTVDIIGHIECDALGANRIPTKNGTTSEQMWCREMKAIEAFSWANFVVLIAAFGTLIALTTRAQTLGRHHAWAQSISDLPWFGQWQEASYDGQSYSYPQYTAPPGGYIVHQQPGHSVVINQNPHGAPPSIQQIHGTVTSA